MRIPFSITNRLIGTLCLLAWSAAAHAADTAAAPNKKELIPNDKCLECHGEKDLTKDLPGGKQLSMFVDEKIRQTSVHAKTRCAESVSYTHLTLPTNREV